MIRRSGAGPALAGAVLALGALLLLPTAPAGAGPGASAPAVGPVVPAAVAPSSGPVPSARDPAIAGAGIGRVFVANADPSAAPNTGLEVNLTGFREVPFPSDASIQIGVDEVIGPYLVAFGLFQNGPNGAFPFLSLFNNSSGRVVAQYNMSYHLVDPGEACDLVLQHANGTVWALTFDGLPFAGGGNGSLVDLGADRAEDPGSILFSAIALASAEVVPSRLDVPTAFGVLTGGGWTLPGRATTSYVGDPAAQWGVEGRQQAGTLWPGEVVLGTSIAPLANGTALWTTGPVPVALSISADPATVNGTGTARIEATASEGAVALPGFPLALVDPGGGSFVDPFPSTDVNGSAATGYTAPNASAPSQDVLRVHSRSLGASGSANATVQLLPAVHVVLSLDGLPSVHRNQTATFVVTARTTDGRAVADVVLFLLLVGDGSVRPDRQATDAFGHVNGSLTSGGSVDPLVVSVVVASPGYWGKLRAVVPIAGPAPSLLSVVLGYLPIVVLAVVVGGVIALYLRRRPPKTAMRPMSLGPRRTPAGPHAPGGPGPEGTPTTPPPTG